MGRIFFSLSCRCISSTWPGSRTHYNRCCYPGIGAPHTFPPHSLYHIFSKVKFQVPSGFTFISHNFLFQSNPHLRTLHPLCSLGPLRPGARGATARHAGLHHRPCGVVGGAGAPRPRGPRHLVARRPGTHGPCLGTSLATLLLHRVGCHVCIFSLPPVFGINTFSRQL